MNNKKKKGKFFVILRIIRKRVKLRTILLLALTFAANSYAWFIYTIVSESMLPKYEIGDMIISKKTSLDNIKLYDDVVYMGLKGDFQDKIVTHQVIDIKNNGGKYIFTTKGLANPTSDPEVSGDQIYGVVVYKTVILSFLSKIVNNTYGFYFIIFVPFAIMVFLEILEVMREKEALKNSGEGYE